MKFPCRTICDTSCADSNLHAPQLAMVLFGAYFGLLLSMHLHIVAGIWPCDVFFTLCFFMISMTGTLTSRASLTDDTSFDTLWKMGTFSISISTTTSVSLTSLPANNVFFQVRPGAANLLFMLMPVMNEWYGQHVLITNQCLLHCVASPWVLLAYFSATSLVVLPWTNSNPLMLRHDIRRIADLNLLLAVRPYVATPSRLECYMRRCTSHACFIKMLAFIATMLQQSCFTPLGILGLFCTVHVAKFLPSIFDKVGHHFNVNSRWPSWIIQIFIIQDPVPALSNILSASCWNVCVFLRPRIKKEKTRHIWKNRHVVNIFYQHLRSTRS